MAISRSIASTEGRWCAMHGTFRGGAPRRGAGGRSLWWLVTRILLREAAAGGLLHAVLGADRRVNLALCLAVLAGLLALTRRHGLLGRGGGLPAVTETLVVFCGALAVNDLIALLPVLLARLA